MRIISQNPEKVIPNLKEDDIKKCLLVVLLDKGTSVAFAIQYIDDLGRKTLNWFGDELPRYLLGYRGFFNSHESLIEFLIYSWNFWENHFAYITKIYILESIQNVDIVCGMPPLVGTPFANVVRDKFNSLRS